MVADKKRQAVESDSHSLNHVPSAVANDPPPPWTEPSTMIPRMGLFTSLFARRYFDRVAVDPEVAQSLHELHRTGTVVHVLPSTSVLDTLVLSRILRREKLPYATFLGGVSLLLVWPIFRLIAYSVKRLFGKGNRTSELEQFENALMSGRSSVLYVKRPRQFFLGGQNLLRPYSEVLLRAQAKSERPIYIVPEFIIWKQVLSRPRQTFWDKLFGDPDAPGALRRLFNFIRHSKRSFFTIGESIDVRNFVSADVDPEHAPELLRTEVLRRFNIERRALAGPILKPARQIRDEILRNAEFDAGLYDLAAELDRPVGEIRKQARRYLKEITADMSLRWLDWVLFLLTGIFRRMYRDIHVERDGLTRLREAARKGPVVYLPAHRSHVDYLVVSYVLKNHGIIPPHIAAGKNMNFFPVGTLFRKCGAFFIRRSFRDRPVYAATFRAYIRKLIKEGIPIEFFIEGGRSRMGKNLPPKYGILRELVLADLSGTASRVQFIPVGLSYEKIVEDQSYLRELSGERKQRESFGKLLGTPRVLADSYGRLTVTFGEPIEIAPETIGELLGNTSDDSVDDTEDTASDGETALTPASSTAQSQTMADIDNAEGFPVFVKRMAYQILKGINDATLITPSALAAWALLAHPRRGVRREELITRVGFLIETLSRNKVPMAPTIVAALAARRTSIDAARAQISLSDHMNVRYSRDEENEYGLYRGLYEELGQAITPLIDEALRSFKNARYMHEEVFENTSVYLVRAERRLLVDRYKNTIIHGLVRECLLAMAISRAVNEDRIVRLDTVKNDCSIVSRVLKYEFTYDPGQTFDEAFAQTWEYFQSMGWIHVQGEQVVIPESSRPLLDYLRRGLMPFLESYHLVVTRAARLREPQPEREFILGCIREGETRYAAGELFAREACSTATMANALNILSELGVLESTGRRKNLSLTGADARAVLENLNSHLVAWVRW